MEIPLSSINGLTLSTVWYVMHIDGVASSAHSDCSVWNADKDEM